MSTTIGSSCCVALAELASQPTRRDPKGPPSFAELFEGGHLGRLDEIDDERADAGSHGVRIRSRRSKS
jgi:hypothetical protein